MWNVVETSEKNKHNTKSNVMKKKRELSTQKWVAAFFLNVVDCTNSEVSFFPPFFQLMGEKQQQQQQQKSEQEEFQNNKNKNKRAIKQEKHTHTNKQKKRLKKTTL